MNVDEQNGAISHVLSGVTDIEFVIEYSLCNAPGNITASLQRGLCML